MIASLATDEADPLERLKSIKHSTRRPNNTFRNCRVKP